VSGKTTDIKGHEKPNLVEAVVTKKPINLMAHGLSEQEQDIWCYDSNANDHMNDKKKIPIH
jgi:hypothetical protein